MVVYPLQQRKMRKRTTQAKEGTRRGSGIQNDKLTEGCVYEDLVHEFMIPPVARQGKGPSRYMLELLRRVLFVMPLWGLQLPLCDDEGSAMKKKPRCNFCMRRDSPARGSCCHCARVGYDARAPPSRDFAARSSLVHPVAHPRPYPRPHRPPHQRQRPCLRSEACRQRDLKEVRAALASRQERTRPARYDAGATGTVELVGLAERAGQLVRLQG